MSMQVDTPTTIRRRGYLGREISFRADHEPADIYEQHKRAFASVSAFVILDKGGHVVAKVAFKYGSRCYCYFHVLGLRMTRGHADGGGYDKASAAAHAAVVRIKPHTVTGGCPEILAHAQRLRAAIKDQGASWDRDVRGAGYIVVQAL